VAEVGWFPGSVSCDIELVAWGLHLGSACAPAGNPESADDVAHLGQRPDGVVWCVPPQGGDEVKTVGQMVGG
jgi:hypothetical protein